MALEALWAVRFGSVQDFGSGIIVFETNRIFGGDTSFYYVGSFTYNPRDQTITGEAKVIRHTPGLPFVIANQDGGTVRLNGHVSEPLMTLTGHLVQDPNQVITVVCRHLHDLP
jgi:hypothetical protein